MCVCVLVPNSDRRGGGGGLCSRGRRLRKGEKFETLINLFNLAAGGLVTLSIRQAAGGINSRVNSKY